MSREKLVWQADALERINKVPFFIRPFVKSRVEKVARTRQLDSINEALIDEIKRKEMPK